MICNYLTEFLIINCHTKYLQENHPESYALTSAWSAFHQQNDLSQSTKAAKLD